MNFALVLLSDLRKLIVRYLSHPVPVASLPAPSARTVTHSGDARRV